VPVSSNYLQIYLTFCCLKNVNLDKNKDPLGLTEHTDTDET